MLISLSWLKTYVQIPDDKERFVRDLSMLGLNVESVDETGLDIPELVIGKVLEAERHPNADRLLVLKIDLGSEERQLVAGIKGHYTAEELAGKQIVVAANLEPATLRGVESQGMLLAAADGDRIVILTPEKKVNPGSKVS